MLVWFASATGMEQVRLVLCSRRRRPGDGYPPETLVAKMGQWAKASTGVSNAHRMAPQPLRRPALAGPPPHARTGSYREWMSGDVGLLPNVAGCESDWDPVVDALTGNPIPDLGPGDRRVPDRPASDGMAAEVVAPYGRATDCCEADRGRQSGGRGGSRVTACFGRTPLGESSSRPLIFAKRRL